MSGGDRSEFRALVDELSDLETRRGGAGLAEGDAARALEIERRLIQLVTTELPQDERRRFVRLPCDLAVTLHAAGRSHQGHIIDVGAGGVFVETTIDVPAGQTVDLETAGFQVSGKIVWSATTRRTGRPGVGIAFQPGDAGLRRFVLELLRMRA